jgi:ABC-type polysaccharide/polyol phosphate export permease
MDPIGLFQTTRKVPPMYLTERISATFTSARENFWQVGLILWRQFTEPYRKTVLGAFWALILPIIPIAAYVMLRLAIQSGAPDTNGIHPVVYVSVGVTLWFLFRDMFMAPVTAVQKQSALISQTHFPVVGAIMVGAGRALMDTFMRVLFCIPFLLLYAQTTPTLGVEAALLMAFGSLLMLCVGVLIIPLWIMLPDVIQVLEVIFRFLIFFSLAIFPLSFSGYWGLTVTANPFAFLIEQVRALAFGKEAAIDLLGIGFIALAAFVSVFIAAYVIGALENRIREMIA